MKSLIVIITAAIAFLTGQKEAVAALKAENESLRTSLGNAEAALAAENLDDAALEAAATEATAAKEAAEARAAELQAQLDELNAKGAELAAAINENPDVPVTDLVL